MNNVIFEAYKKISTKVENDKINILVFNGFKYEQIKFLENKLFDKIEHNRIDLDIQKNNNLDLLMKIIIRTNNDKDTLYWITFEEFVNTFDAIREYVNYYVINNNIYNKVFPYDNTLDDISFYYEEFFFNNDEEIGKENRKKYELITKFYGDILYSKDSDRYYVVHNQKYFDKIIKYDLFNEEAFIYEDLYGYSTSNLKVEIELTEDETKFLDMTQDLIERKLEEREIEIVIVSNLEDLTNRYVERFYLLKRYFSDDKKLFFTKKTTNSLEIEKIEEYKSILKKYWGYDSFRSLKMYRDIKSKSREIIEISQAQIINDIVEQSSKAYSDEEKSYRDIFITSSTGSGKSIMFQIPAIYLKEKYSEINPLTIVISPLIALMNDQIDNMKKKGINFARTINSNTDGYKRDEIIDEITNGECSLLYLSPETLQSRYDIKQLIGDRRLGLVIVDEAHIVTTWGKSFRADYWYLGIYLQKLRKQYDFPIVTFTATAIYGGKEDMYLETRDSLNMINPISYFGKVKRDDIKMLISSSDKDFSKNGGDYRKTKNTLAIERVKKFNEKNEKALIYFPTVRLLNEFYGFIKQNAPSILDIVGRYHGKLEKEEKNSVLEGYKSGELMIVLATKAFGMGVDIDDITNVYHYAPSGSVTDYIQEIGRVARDSNKVEVGYAWCDFLQYDFTEVKRLYGMSRITKYELLRVMEKIKKLYEAKDFNRNLLISADDFKHAFNNKEDDIEDLDNKIKTALLLIEKDFSSPSNLGYPPFAARPRGVFGRDIILLREEEIKDLSHTILNKYINQEYILKESEYKYIYSIDLAKLWEDHYRKVSFPNFKRIIYEKKELSTLKDGYIFKKLTYSTGIRIRDTDRNNQAEIISIYKKYIDLFSDFLDTQKRKEIQFDIKILGKYIQTNSPIKDEIKSRSIAQTLINACFEYQKLKGINIIRERVNTDLNKYKILNSYDVFIEFAKQQFTNFLKNKKQYCVDDNDFVSFYIRGDYSDISYNIIVLAIAEILELTSFSIENGNTPQIYMRINSIYPLEKAIKQGSNYVNGLLQKVHQKHYISMEMLTYLFSHKSAGNSQKEKIENYTMFFWDKIEDYFLGTIPAEVEEKLSK